MSQPVFQTAAIRVLIIEDQHDIAANIWDFLENRGYQVDHCADGSTGLARALDTTFDVIVLDIGLPRMDGLELCRRLREAGKGVPVIMLTARDTLNDKLLGYGEGADDYLVKPFEMRELEARIRAVLRGKTHTALVNGGLSYDPKTMVASRDGQRIALTRLQGAILGILLIESPRIVTYAQILDAAWQAGDGDLPALQTQIYELRLLIDKPFETPLIHTVRGIGYRLEHIA
ncbi:response regulator transcription factor [Lysobacter soyae]|uniref:Response regulator transcription factor n=1 Tax=Lysobacter soyae TaxID=2764185 RepID=A0ABX8WNB3_9GAMM|nr:response regulator transcription factor [Lysobacter sp. CJ11]QYR52622.1 response regulator transcription factor [Lysobacter sp. CJ11]